MQLALEDRIRQRAYFLSLSGGGSGDQTHFWLVAEREVLTEVPRESVVASPEAIQSMHAVKPTAVAQAILRIVNDDATAAKMGQAGRTLAAQYSWPEIGRRMRLHYQSILEHRKADR